MKRCRHIAFTLMEALVSLSLFTMIMFLMANLMGVAANSEKLLGEKDRIQEVSVSCLYRMAHELRGANQWIEPLSGSSNQMIFECPDWQLEGQEFPTPPTPFPGSWTAGAAAFQMRIRYSLNSGQLERRLMAESQIWVTPLLQGCQLFTVERESPSLVHLSLTVLSRGAPKLISARVLLPQEMWVPR